jgi:hypothetical protein
MRAVVALLQDRHQPWLMLNDAHLIYVSAHSGNVSRLRVALIGINNSSTHTSCVAAACLFIVTANDEAEN